MSIQTKIIPLGELVDFEGGGTPSKAVATYWNGGIPWASVKDILGIELSKTCDSISAEGLANSASRLVPAGNVIIPTRMALGRAAINTIDVAINQDLRVAYSRGSIDERYLLWFIIANSQKIESLGSGATVKGITLDKLRGLTIPIPHKNGKPDLEEQKRIAAILDKADAIRRKRQQALRLTDDFLRSLFLDMFGNPALSPKPKRIVTVADAGDVQLGRQRAPKYQTGKWTRPYVRVANVFENRIDTTDVLSMDFDERDFTSYRLRKGDILLNEGQSTELVGRPAMWRDEIENCCFQNTLVRFTAFERVTHPYYALFVFLHYLWFGKFAQISSKTSSVAHLGAGRFSAMPFPLPDYRDQLAFAEVAEGTYQSSQRKSLIEKQSQELFSSLQQRAFRGEL